MVVLPVVTELQTGGQTLSIVDDGLDESSVWEDNGEPQDLPWRKGQTSVVRVFDNTVEDSIVTQADPAAPPAWSNALQDELSRTSTAWQVDGVVPTASVSFGGALAHASIGARHDASTESIYQTCFIGSFAQSVERVDPATTLPSCPTSEALESGDASFDAALGWMTSASQSAMTLEWPFGEAPEEDWQTWQ